MEWIIDHLLIDACAEDDAACVGRAWRNKLGGTQGVRAAIEGALHEAVLWCRESLGQDASTWRWGEAHRAQYAHPNPSVRITLTCSVVIHADRTPVCCNIRSIQNRFVVYR